MIAPVPLQEMPAPQESAGQSPAAFLGEVRELEQIAARGSSLPPADAESALKRAEALRNVVGLQSWYNGRLRRIVNGVSQATEVLGGEVAVLLERVIEKLVAITGGAVVGVTKGVRATIQRAMA